MDSRLSLCVLGLVVGALFAFDVEAQRFKFHLPHPNYPVGSSASLSPYAARRIDRVVFRRFGFLRSLRVGSIAQEVVRTPGGNESGFHLHLVTSGIGFRVVDCFASPVRDAKGKGGSVLFS